MENPDKQSLALAFLTQSVKYLELAEKIFEQMVKDGNLHTLSGDWVTEGDLWKEYHEKTKWSDFNVIFPTLFLFYHGLELMIKGLLPLFGSNIVSGHSSDLLILLKKQNGVEGEIINITEKYLNLNNLRGSPLGDWLEKNNLDVDKLYERLRYPTDRTHMYIANNFPLKYRESKMIPFVTQIIGDSKRLRFLFISQLNKIYPNKP